MNCAVHIDDRLSVQPKPFVTREFVLGCVAIKRIVSVIPIVSGSRAELFSQCSHAQRYS